MCQDCWEKYGSPKIINPRTLGVQELINEVYAYHGAGGLLHIVLDDWNLEDSMVRSCLYDIEHHPAWWEYGDDGQEAMRACAKAFMEMSLEERASALAIHDRMHKPAE